MTREEAIQVLKMVEAYGLADEAKHMAIEALKAEPAEVVRCKECKEWNEYARDKLGRCDCHLITTSADDFCSYGERGEE